MMERSVIMYVLMYECVYMYDWVLAKWLSQGKGRALNCFVVVAY